MRRGRHRLCSCLGALLLAVGLTGCVARHLLPPPLPAVDVPPRSFEGLRFTLGRFELQGATVAEQRSAAEEAEALAALRGAVQAQLAATVRAGGGAVVRRPGDGAAGQSLVLDLALEIAHDANRTFVLDGAGALAGIAIGAVTGYFGVFPLLAALQPFVPQWGDATVSLRARISLGERVLTTLRQDESAPYLMLAYAWYRRGPIEEACQVALARALAGMLHKLALYQPMFTRELQEASAGHGPPLLERQPSEPTAADPAPASSPGGPPVEGRVVVLPLAGPGPLDQTVALVLDEPIAATLAATVDERIELRGASAAELAAVEDWLTCTEDPRCLRGLGARLGAELLVVGTVRHAPQAPELTLSVVRPRDGVLLWREVVTCSAQPAAALTQAATLAAKAGRFLTAAAALR